MSYIKKSSLLLFMSLLTLSFFATAKDVQVTVKNACSEQILVSIAPAVDCNQDLVLVKDSQQIPKDGEVTFTVPSCSLEDGRAGHVVYETALLFAGNLECKFGLKSGTKHLTFKNNGWFKACKCHID